jgi:hypothetical protein
MKKLFITILCSLPLFSLAQKSIQIEQGMNKGIAFLQFSSDSCSPAFITKLNASYGYQQSLVAIYNDAPNFDDKKYSTKEIIKLIDSIRNDERQGSLASIEYDIIFNDNNLFSFRRLVMPEGEKSSTNSTVSDYNYVFPKNYDIKYEKEIKSVAYFLTADGIKNIQKIIQKVMYKRAKLYFGNKNSDDCHSGTNSFEEYENKSYTISNNTSDIDMFKGDEKTFYFVFTENGLELANNFLDIQSLQCYGPPSGVTIPWFDLKQYCINKLENTVLQACNSRIKEAAKVDWIVKSKYANLLDTPDDLETNPPIPVAPYIVKGEKVTALSQSGEFLKVKYLTNNGKEILAWVKISDFE